MRVGLISFHSFSRPGGVKRHVLGLQKEFKRRGIYSKIIVPRRKIKEFYGKDVILLGTSFPIRFSGSQSDFDINFNPLAIERVLNREKFDVLHFHNFGFPSALQILTSPSSSSALNILTFHANIKGSRFLRGFPFFLNMLEKIIQWKIDGIIGVAPLNIRIFKNYKGPKAVIPNGIDLEEFNPKGSKIKKFLDGKINILFLGRIEKRKGLIYLLKAYQMLEKRLKRNWVLSNLRLIVAGSGPLRDNLEEWAKKNKLENVIFEGEVKEKKVPRYYRSCDIFVSPAIFGESFGIVLVEAMASGVPVVAFANEGYKEVLKSPGKKFLVKSKDYKTLSRKIESLIKDKKLREKMGRWGIKEARKYSWQKIADQILDFYELAKQRKKKKKGIIIS